MKSGLQFSFLICIVSTLILCTYLLFYPDSFLYSLGIISFRLGIILGIEFIICVFKMLVMFKKIWHIRESKNLASWFQFEFILNFILIILSCKVLIIWCLQSLNVLTHSVFKGQFLDLQVLVLCWGLNQPCQASELLDILNCAYC